MHRSIEVKEKDRIMQVDQIGVLYSGQVEKCIQEQAAEYNS